VILKHHRRWAPLFIIGFCGVLFVALWPIAGLGQAPRVDTKKPAPEPAGATLSGKAMTRELTGEDVEAFLDGLMPMQLQRENIAGAVISVVRDGKIIFAKGYGYSDVAKKTPVLPDQTLFRPGSVSKLITWTAVMQLVEQGKLNLDRDVNDYLDFKVPATHPKPLTIRDLMTHTPGFEETLQQLFVADTKDLVPLGDYMKAHLPNRVFPPFTTPAYSNYGASMAGYIVERISGQSFDDYLDEHIFKPLGMMHSTFRQPLPENLKPLMSNGYVDASGEAKPFEVVQAVPAGSGSSTATDMARFMLAHLQGGQLDGARILKPETVEMMHTRQFENLPTMDAMCVEFYEENRNGHRVISHAGDTQYFHSDLHLVTDAGVGFFVSYNSLGKTEISPRTAVWHAFLDRYFPYDLPSATPISSATQDAHEISGHYMASRRADTTILKALSLAGETKIQANADNTIGSKDFKDLAGKPRKFVEIAPMMFRDVKDQDRVAFKRDDSGRWILVIDYPFEVLQRVRWYENSALNLPILIVTCVVFVLTLLLWPIAALLRRHYGIKLDLKPEHRKLRRLSRIVSALCLLFPLGFVLFFSAAQQNLSILYPRNNWILRLNQIVGWLGVIGGLLVIFHVIRTWSVLRRLSRFTYALTALACAGFIWFVYVWNMLHWSLKY
jgi:CubicO group peptidase (beta-lactamase class C family)